jgi:hypothetical protein
MAEDGCIKSVIYQDIDIFGDLLVDNVNIDKINVLDKITFQNLDITGTLDVSGSNTVLYNTTINQVLDASGVSITNNLELPDKSKLFVIETPLASNT